jgi:hypothetical protein
VSACENGGDVIGNVEQLKIAWLEPFRIKSSCKNKWTIWQFSKKMKENCGKECSSEYLMKDLSDGRRLIVR